MYSIQEYTRPLQICVCEVNSPSFRFLVNSVVEWGRQIGFVYAVGCCGCTHVRGKYSPIRLMIVSPPDTSQLCSSFIARGPSSLLYHDCITYHTGVNDHSSNPPTARKPSTTRLYSRRSSLTSNNRSSSAVASKKRWFGGAMRGSTGDVGRLDSGDSTRFAAGVDARGGGRRDVCRDGDGEA